MNFLYNKEVKTALIPTLNGCIDTNADRLSVNYPLRKFTFKICLIFLDLLTAIQYNDMWERLEKTEYYPIFSDLLSM